MQHGTHVLLPASLLSTEWHYSNIEERSLEYYTVHRSSTIIFAEEVFVITDNNLLVAIINKDVATFSLCIMLSIYKSGPSLYIVDWLL